MQLRGFLWGVTLMVVATDAAASPCALTTPAGVTTYTCTVDSTADTNDVTPGDAVCGSAAAGSCTLRAAIQEANALSAAGTRRAIDIDLAAPQTAGVATYSPATPYQIATAGHTDTVVTISGRNSDAGNGTFVEADVIDGGNARRLFIVGDEVLNRRINFALRQLTVQRGSSGMGTGCPSAPNGSGGAIQVCRTNPIPTPTPPVNGYNKLSLTYVLIKNSAALTPGALAGGGIFVDVYSELEMFYSTFEGNSALGTDPTSDTSAGGALMLAGKSYASGASNFFINNRALSGGALKTAGFVDCSECVFYGNQALGTGGNGGGAVYLDTDFGVSGAFNGGFFENNYAETVGGAIWSGAYRLAAPLAFDVLDIYEGYFINNRARDSGGAVYISKSSALSGLRERDGTVEIVDDPFYYFNGVLFYRNTAGVPGVQLGNGGAVYSDLPGVVFINTTFTQNTATGSAGALYVHACNSTDSVATVKCTSGDSRHDGKMNNVTMVDNHDIEDLNNPANAGGAGFVFVNGDANGYWEFKISNSVFASNSDTSGAPIASNCLTTVSSFPNPKFFSAGHNVFGTSADPPFHGGVNLQPCPAGFLHATDVTSATYDSFAALGLDGISVPAYPADLGYGIDFYMTPQAGSPLLDKGAPTVGTGTGECDTEDQTFVPGVRPQNGRCDIGAVERVMAPPTFQFTTATSAVSEEAGTHTITVSISTAYGVATTVPFTVGAGTTASGGEYTVTTSSPLTFAPGVTSQTIAFTLTGDGVLEGNEQIVVTLGAPSIGTIGTPGTHTITVIDDETPQPPVLTLPAGPFSTADTNPVTVGAGSSVSDFDSTTLTVTVTVVGGTASVSGPATIGGNDSTTVTLTGSPADLTTTLQSLQLTPAPGSTQVDISVVASDGALNDSDTLTVTVSLMPGLPLPPPSAPAAQVGVNDADQDGIGDATDNCINTPNANQADQDGDGIGDVCDRDANNDGFYDDVGASGGGIIRSCSATGTESLWWALAAIAALRRRSPPRRASSKQQ